MPPGCGGVISSETLQEVRMRTKGKQDDRRTPFAHPDKIVKIGTHIHWTLLLFYDKINRSTVGNKMMFPQFMAKSNIAAVEQLLRWSCLSNLSAYSEYIGIHLKFIEGALFAR